MKKTTILFACALASGPAWYASRGDAAEYLATAALKPIGSLANPDHLETVIDPAFGSPIMRVTEPGAAPCDPAENYCRHRYSSSQAWSADQGLLSISKGLSGAAILDGRTYRYLYTRDTPGDCDWHPVQPQTMICVKGSEVKLYDVPTNKARTVLSLSRYKSLSMGGKGNPSFDGRWIAVTAENPSGAAVAFAIDLVNGSKTADLPTASLTRKVSYATVSPSGKYLAVYEESSSGGRWWIHDRATNARVQHWPEYHRPGHGDMTIDRDGEDIVVGVSKSDPDKYHVIKRRLRDGRVTDLTPGRRTMAQHVSTRSIRRPGWALVTFDGDLASAKKSSRYPLYQEVAALRLDGSGEIVRIAHTRSIDGDYESEAHGSPSPDLSRVIFASNWSKDGGPIAAYVVTSPN